MHAIWLAALLCTSPEAKVSAPAPVLGPADVVRRALEVAPSVAGAGLAHQQAAWRTVRANLERVSARLDARVSELWARPGPAGVLGLSNLSAALSVPLFSGFRVSAGVSRAEALEQAAAADLSQERLLTALSALRAYWSLSRFTAALDAQRSAVARLEHAERIAEARLRAGLAPAVDRSRAEARRQAQVAELALLEGQAQQARVELGVLLQLPGELRVLTPPPLRPGPAPELTPLVDQALSTRPDVLGARRRWLAAERLTTVARSGYYPQLSLDALLEYGNNPTVAGSGARAVSGAPSDPFRNLGSNAQVLLTLSWNLFDTLGTYSAVKEASLSAARAAEEVRAAEQQARLSVQSAHANVAQLLAQAAPLARTGELARDTVQILGKSYQNGSALMLELLDAELELLAAERSVAEVSAQLALARVELAVAAGDWEGVLR